MDMQRGVSIPNLKAEDLINHMENCCLCGGKLRFTHKTDFANLEVVEEATCPSCGVKSKVNNFILQ